jgi:GT2 family glycosyltransferase
MIMSREAFVSVGGFDEKLETNEDCDLCFRLGKEGYRMVSIADTAVIHLRPPRSLDQVFKKELWHGKEVFKVFLGDVRSSGDMNIFIRKNSMVVLYALCYLLLLFLLAGAIVIALSRGSFVPLVVALGLPFFLSFLLSLKYAGAAREGSLIPGLTVLLTVYGVSRAISLLPYEKVITRSVKS